MSETASEHTRFQRYLHKLEQVPEHGESDLLGAVLRDPDQAMAVSAVLQHIDRRASGLDDDQFAQWAAQTATRVEGHAPLVRRLRDWTTLKAINAGQPIDGAALADATDWLQRTLAETTTSSAALTILAESGRTRRVRNTASIRARRPAH
ncbi:MAG TPA: hypothetical protein VFU74_11115 [Actinocrinis sp.]|nr:hypothetical protein [Actinocrinis sp.]